jgi:L-arabinose isomerase
VEADVKVAIAMTVLKVVGGSATLAELYSMDFTRDVCLIGHSGAADPMIATERGTLRKSAVFHGKPGGGFLTQFSPTLGPVTLLSLTQDSDGDYRFVVAEGDVVPGKVLHLGDTNAPVRFRQGVRAFIDAWAYRGPTHHATLGRGHHAAVLAKAAKLLGVPIESV